MAPPTTPPPATEPGIAALIDAKGIPVVLTEPGVATAPAIALAQATHTKVGQLDTVTVRTPIEEARNKSYLAIMTDNLASLTSAMACPSDDRGLSGQGRPDFKIQRLPRPPPSDFPIVSAHDENVRRRLESAPAEA